MQNPTLITSRPGVGAALGLALFSTCAGPAPTPRTAPPAAPPAVAPRGRPAPVPTTRPAPAPRRAPPRPQARRTDVPVGGRPGQQIIALAVARDRVFLALSDGRVRGFRGERPAFWLTPSAPAAALEAAADGRFLLITSRRGTNWVFDVSGAAPVKYRRWERKTGRSQGLTADGQMLVRGDVRGQVRGYALEGYKLKWLQKATEVALSADGRWAACRQGQALAVHDARTGRSAGVVQRATGQVTALGVASAHRLAWVEETAGRCTLHLTGAAPRPVTCHRAARLVFSPDGALLALSLGAEVQLRDGRTGSLTARHHRVGGALLAAPLDARAYVVTGLAPDRLSWFRLPGPAPAPRRPRSR